MITKDPALSFMMFHVRFRANEVNSLRQLTGFRRSRARSLKKTELRIWMKPRRGSSCFLAKHRRVKDVHFLRTSGSSFLLCVGNRTPCFFFKEGSRIFCLTRPYAHCKRKNINWRMKCKIIMVASVASMTVDACSLYGESIFADLLKPFECQIC